MSLHHHHFAPQALHVKHKKPKKQGKPQKNKKDVVCPLKNRPSQKRKRTTEGLC
jgi:hypothetical protein